MEPDATTVAQYQLHFAPALRKAPSLLASIPDRTTWVSHMLEQASATSDTFLHAATSAPNTLPQLPPAPHVSYNHFPTTMDPVRTHTISATACSCTKASRVDSHCWRLGSHQPSATHFAATARRTPPPSMARRPPRSLLHDCPSWTFRRMVSIIICSAPTRPWKCRQRLCRTRQERIKSDAKSVLLTLMDVGVFFAHQNCRAPRPCGLAPLVVSFFFAITC